MTSGSANPRRQLDIAKNCINGARNICALTRAGMSTDSGIPDFRGPQGVWTKNPAAEKIWNITEYVRNPEIRRLAWEERLTSPIREALPAIVGR